MKEIQINKSEFKPTKVTGSITGLSNVLNKMSSALLSNAPKDVVVEQDDTSVTISYNNKKVVASVWVFSLPNVECKSLDTLREDGLDCAAVYDISFYNENGDCCTDINNCIRALGFAEVEKNKAAFMLGTKAMMWARKFSDEVKVFFLGRNNLLDVLAVNLPSDTKVVASSPTSFKAEVAVNDYTVTIFAVDRNGDLDFLAHIPHKYTEYDYVYGKRFADTIKSEMFKSEEDITNYDWNALWEYLYDNRNGRCMYSGSL